MDVAAFRAGSESEPFTLTLLVVLWKRMELPKVVLLIQRGIKFVVPPPATLAAFPVLVAASVWVLGVASRTPEGDEETVAFAGALKVAGAKAEGGSPPRVCASPAFNA